MSDWQQIELSLHVSVKHQAAFHESISDEIVQDVQYGNNS